MKNRAYILPLGLCGIALILAILAIWQDGDEREAQINHAESLVGSSKLGPRPRLLERTPGDRVRDDTRIGHSSREEFGAALPPRVEFLLGDSSDLSVRQRIDWLKSNRRSLISEDIDAILDFLDQGRVPAGLSLSHWHWLADQLLTSMRGATHDPAGLSGRLYDVFENVTLDPTLRDYLLQHLGHLLDDGGEPAKIWGAVRRGLSERHQTMAGTALLIVNDKHRRAQLGDERLRPPSWIGDPATLAIELLKDPDLPVPSQITALSVASDSGLEAIEEHATRLLMASENSQVRLAAAMSLVESTGSTSVLDGIVAVHPLAEEVERVVSVVEAARNQ